jgi:hypothetical protein
MPTIGRDQLDPAFDDAEAAASPAGAAVGEEVNGTTATLPPADADATAGAPSDPPPLGNSGRLPKGVGGDNPEETAFEPPRRWANAGSENAARPGEVGDGGARGGGPTGDRGPEQMADEAVRRTAGVPAVTNGSATNGEITNGDVAHDDGRRDGDADRYDETDDGIGGSGDAGSDHGAELDDVIGRGRDFGADQSEYGGRGGGKPSDAGPSEDGDAGAP